MIVLSFYLKGEAVAERIYQDGRAIETADKEHGQLFACEIRPGHGIAYCSCDGPDWFIVTNQSDPRRR